MAFIDAYPGTRLPVLAPINWGSDGFPILESLNGTLGNYIYPETPHFFTSPTETDYVEGTYLSPQ